MRLDLCRCYSNENVFRTSHEPPCTEPYARWCERTGGLTAPLLLDCARHVAPVGGVSPLRAVTSGTASLGKGVRREAESEGSRWQNADPTNRNRIRPGRRGDPAMDGDARYSSGRRRGKSGGACAKEARLTLGDLFACPGDACVSPDYRFGDESKWAERSQQRP